MSNSYEKRLRALLREGDVIPFPDSRSREQRKQKPTDVQDKLQKLANDMPMMFADQEAAEHEVNQKVLDVMENGASHRKKFVLPFIMKNYREGTNPIQAIVWALHEYLQAGESEELNMEQIRFTYNFFAKNLTEMEQALKEDISKLERIRDWALDMDISLPAYAAQPAARAIYSLKDLLNELNAFRMYDGVFYHPERTWAQRQVKHRDALLTEDDKVTSGDPFDRTRTGMPFYDEMLEKPEYFEEAKGIVFVIMEMSPTEYLERCVKGFEREHVYSVDGLLRSREQEKAIKYSREMLRGTKFPMPVLAYENLGFTQEGIHRVWAARIAGYNKIPVMITDNTTERKEMIRKRQKEKTWGFW